MADEEKIYDDIAMENVHVLLKQSNSKLMLANDYYSSNKLSGKTLVNDVERFMNDISPFLSKYYHAADEIYEGSFSNIDSFESTGVPSEDTLAVNSGDSNSQDLDMYDLTEEDLDEIIKVFENDVKEKEDILKNFGKPTPEENSKTIFANARSYRSKDEMDADIAKYQIEFEEAFKEMTGMTYLDFMEQLNESREILASFNYYKYLLHQQLKEIPYLKIMETEEFKKFAKNEFDLLEAYYVDTGLYYNDYDADSGTYKTYCYLSKEEEIMLLYLYKYGGEGSGLPSVSDFKKDIKDKINKAKGERDYIEFIRKHTDENGKIDYDIYSIFDTANEGFEDGVKNFINGLENAFTNNDVISDEAYKQMYLLQFLEETGSASLSFLYQNTYTIGNMSIPMVASLLTGNKIVGSTLLGVSAGGNSKNQALIDGKSLLRSSIYGAVSGLSEAGLGYLLGKLPLLSKNSGFTLKNLLEEGLEEFSQEWIDAGLRAICLRENIDLSDVTDNSLKSFLMGIVVAGELNGVSYVSLKINNSVTKLDLNKLNEYFKNHPKASSSKALAEVMTNRGSKVRDTVPLTFEDFLKNIKKYSARGYTYEQFFYDNNIVVQTPKSKIEVAELFRDGKLYLLEEAKKALKFSKNSKLSDILYDYKYISNGDLNINEMAKKFQPYLEEDVIQHAIDLERQSPKRSTQQLNAIYNYTLSTGFKLNAYLNDCSFWDGYEMIRARDEYRNVNDIQNSESGAFINHSLRNRIYFSDDGNIISDLDSVISSANYSEAIVTFRGVKELYDGNKIINVKKLKIGDSVISDGYQSTSALFERNYGYTNNDCNVILKVIIPPNSGVGAYIENDAGICNYGQMEVLLGRNIKLIVCGDMEYCDIRGTIKALIPVIAIKGGEE